MRELEQLDFAEAVEWLAERFRVTLEYEEMSPQVEEARRRRERLQAVLEQATSFYERHLWDSAAGEPPMSQLNSAGDASARAAPASARPRTLPGFVEVSP